MKLLSEEEGFEKRRRAETPQKDETEGEKIDPGVTKRRRTQVSSWSRSLLAPAASAELRKVARHANPKSGRK